MREDTLPPEMQVGRDIIWRFVDLFKRDIYSSLRRYPSLDVLKIIDYAKSEDGFQRKLRGFSAEMKFYQWANRTNEHWRIIPLPEFIPGGTPDFHVETDWDSPEQFDVPDEEQPVAFLNGFYVDVKSGSVDIDSMEKFAGRFAPLIVATEKSNGKWKLHYVSTSENFK